MTRGSGRGGRAVAATWAGIAEICLVGVILIWSTASAGGHAGYGRSGSIGVLGVSILLTAVAGAVVLRPSGSRGTARLTLAGVLAVTAGGVVPLAITDLVSAGTGVYVLLVMAVIGMGVVAAHLIRSGGPLTVQGSERDR